MCRDYLQAGRFPDDGQVSAKSAGGQSARTGLGVFLVHQTGKDDFRSRGSCFLLSKFGQGHHHGRDRAFCIARTATIKTAIVGSRLELRFCPVNRIQMWRKQDALPHVSRGHKASQKVVPAREHGLKIDV